MKCEIIRDLLPLYIDGLTSKESNQEIEKHLKNCEECQKYYQEMTGDIDNFSVITNEEIEDVNLIKKIKKKNRKKALGIFVGAFVLSGVLMGVGFHWTHGVAMYENVILNYGVQGDTAYLTLQGKPGYELNFSGATDQNKSSLKVMYARNIWGHDENVVRLEGERMRFFVPDHLAHFHFLRNPLQQNASFFDQKKRYIFFFLHQFLQQRCHGNFRSAHVHGTSQHQYFTHCLPLICFFLCSNASRHLPHAQDDADPPAEADGNRRTGCEDTSHIPPGH